MELEFLERIGLTEGEAKVYLALLKIGETTVGSIIKEANVSSSKVYDILDRLSKKGLISSVIKNNRKIFRAADPSRLKEFVELKEKEIQEEKKELDEVIPSLQEMQKYASPKQEAEILEGIGGIKTFNEMILNQLGEKDVFYILGAPKEATETMNAYFLDWHKRRIQKKVICRMLFNFDAKKYGEERKKLKHTEVRYLPKDIVTPALIDISKDYVATILFGERPLCIVIRNKKIAESYLAYFNLLWKTAKS